MSVHEYVKLISHHGDEAHKKNYDWIRHGITILTPSLALLIGLQVPDLSSQKIKCISLVITVSLMTISILLGLLALRGEAKLHHLKQEALVDELGNDSQKEAPIREISLPNLYFYPLVAFPFLLSLSVFSLGIFGVLKYII